MDEKIRFYRFDLEAVTDAPTLTNAESDQVYIAIECQNGRCDQRKLMHPSSVPVSQDDFQNLDLPTVASRMRCTQCKTRNPRISYFREYDPLYIGELVGEKELVPFHWLSKDETFCGDRYNYQRSVAAGWVRPDMQDDDLYDLGSTPDPIWNENEPLAGSEPGMEVDQFQIEQAARNEAYLAKLEAAKRDKDE